MTKTLIAASVAALLTASPAFADWHHGGGGGWHGGGGGQQWHGNGWQTAVRAPGMVEAGPAEVAGLVAGDMAGVVAAADGVVALASGLAR